MCLVLPRIQDMYWNINQFPFPVYHLVNTVRINLLLADLHCQETLALSMTWILTMLRSYYRQDSHHYSIHSLLQESFCSSSAPIYHAFYNGPQYRQLI